MIAFKLQFAPRGPLFSEEQWLAIANRLELSPCAFQIVKLVFEDAGAVHRRGAWRLREHDPHAVGWLYRKLGATSRVGLVLRIVRAHLADAGTWLMREVDRSEPPAWLHPPARKAA